MIGSILKKIRLNTGLSQTKCADIFKMKRSSLSAIENNKRYVSVGKIVKMMELYDQYETGLTKMENELLNEYINNKSDESIKNIKKLDCVEVILEMFNYPDNVEDEDKLALYDDVEYNLLKFLNKKKCL